MVKNIHFVDKSIRLIISVVLFMLMITTHDDLVLELILGLLGIYFAVTAALGICAIYIFLDVTTIRRKKDNHY